MIIRDDGCVSVPARAIPLPCSISDAARASLRRMVDDDGNLLNAAFDMPAADDHAGWIRLRSVVDARYAAMLAHMAGDNGAAVETETFEHATVHVATPGALRHPHRTIVDLHGGALVFGGGEACRIGGARLADRHGVRCHAIDYRMPPEHPYPAALYDCVAAYRFVLARYRPGDIVIHGRSAGGNIAAAMLLRARDEGLPMPAGLVLLSPQVDLTESGDSFQTIAMVDGMLPRPLMSNNLLYAAGRDLADPCLSPLFGDLRGFPPTLLQTGTRDLFLSNTVRMHRALRKAGVAADLHVFEAMPHGGFGGDAPEDAELAAEVSRFMEACWEARHR